MMMPCFARPHRAAAAAADDETRAFHQLLLFSQQQRLVCCCSKFRGATVKSSTMQSRQRNGIEFAAVAVEAAACSTEGGDYVAALKQPRLHGATQVRPVEVETRQCHRHFQWRSSRLGCAWVVLRNKKILLKYKKLRELFPQRCKKTPQ